MSFEVRGAVALGLALWSLAASAAVEGPGKEQYLRAARAQSPVRVDGRLDEADWAQAPVFDAFVERFPSAGKAPSERTELRILYDEDMLYVGVVARDSEPALIDRRLGRRDSAPYSDTLHVLVDSTHGHRTAYQFSLSAGGVQSDGLYYDDRYYTEDWSGIWAGAAGSVEDGWVAEFAIPLSLLRFPDAPMQTWGFSVRRDIARKNEELESVDNPRNHNANVSRLGHLTGMEDLRPRRRVELMPYLAARGLARPQFSDASRPTPRLLSPSMDVGLDVRAALTSELSLAATFNPDFGEVEADELLLNLSTFEAYFPERRPFFTQGMELFQPVGMGTGDAPLALFYSRRIGLTTPLLGAVKVTGSVGDVQVGVLDAFVTGPWQHQDEERPDHGLRLDWRRPLHVGPGLELPDRPSPTTHFLVAVARGHVGEGSVVGGAVTLANPLSGTCTAEDAALEEDLRPAACRARGGYSGALDFDLKTQDGQWGVYGMMVASRVDGGLPSRTLEDGTRLHDGDSGAGGYLRAGRFGGEGLRPEVGVDVASPTLSLAATGFQRAQNEVSPRATLRYSRPNGMGPFREFYAHAFAASRWTADARRERVVTWLNFLAEATLPSFDVVGLETGANLNGFDVRELSRTGVALERHNRAFVSVYGETNPKRILALDATFSLGHRFKGGPSASAWGWYAEASLSLRPHPSLETELSVSNDLTDHGPRYVETRSPREFLLGELESQFLSLTLRQQWVLTPRLTLQGYAQLFTAHGTYGPFFTATSDARNRRIRLDSLVPVDHQDDSSFYDTALNVNVVARWEYQLGSTFFVVYSRTQQGLPVAERERPHVTLRPRRLTSGPATDALMLKWSYYWDA
ncbi:carbohydrate binding family 9 domain-containing protein [Myxococcus stipitatus]|uniref:carbohydrate binding family 9 domain-containing protein n=1 Tax=Myxococcus stipitatus TaxID=83455 RepID=UPI0030D49C54